MRAERWALLLVLLLAAPSLRAQEPEGQPAEGAEPAEGQEETSPAEEPAGGAWFAVVGGTIHTGTGAVIHSGTVLARAGRIVAVGQGLAIPAGAEVLEAGGRPVYPGLVAFDSQRIVGSPPEDASDVNALEWTLCLSTGITTVGAGGSVAKLTLGRLEGHLLAKDALVKLDLAPRATHDLKRDLDRLVELRRKTEAAELRRARGEPETPLPDRRWVRGRLAALEGLLAGKSRAWVQTNELGQVIALCELCRRYGFRAVVEGAVEAWTQAPLLGRSGVAAVVVPRARRPQDPRLSRPSGWTIEAAARLHEAGVDLAILSAGKGVSTGGLAGRDLWTLPLEGAFAVRGGLSQAAALEALTLGPARLLGVAHRVGSLEPGKDCDLIVTSGDLLHYESLVEWAVVDGRVVYDKAKDTLLRHVRPRSAEEGEVPEAWPRRPGTPPPDMPR